MNQELSLGVYIIMMSIFSVLVYKFSCKLVDKGIIERVFNSIK
ncbi:hypothetical protein ACQPU1_09760 [Clostridium paraputrificum]